MSDPKDTITPEMATLLMQIAAQKENNDRVPISPDALAHLRDSARLRSVYYSMQMAGSSLTLEQVTKIIKKESALGGRRDEYNMPLSTHQRALISLFVHHEYITTKEIATFFKLNPRTARYQCQQLVRSGFLVVANASKKKRTYALAPRFRNYI
jgi:Fic family protein